MTQAQTAESNNYADIKRRLSEPIPANLISYMDKGGASIAFVNITDIKDLLDARAGIWESSVADFKQIGESLCCVVRVVVHASDGIFAQEGTGVESLNMRGYGDIFSNSYAQALRRACEGHGLGRELWRKEDHGQQTPQRANSPANPNNPQAPRQFAPTEKPANGKATSAGDLATAKQLGMLRAIVRERGLSMDEVIERAFPGIEEGHLSKKSVSWMIEKFREAGK